MNNGFLILKNIKIGVKNPLLASLDDIVSVLLWITTR